MSTEESAAPEAAAAAAAVDKFDVDEFVKVVTDKLGTDNVEKAKGMIGAVFSWIKAQGVKIQDYAPAQVQEMVTNAEQQQAKNHESGERQNLIESALSFLEKHNNNNNKSRDGEAPAADAGAAAPAAPAADAAAPEPAPAADAEAAPAPAPAPAAAAPAPAAAADGSPSGNTDQIDSLMELMGFMKKLGVEPQQVAKALPGILTYVQQNLNIDLSKLLSQIPGGAAAGGSSTGGAETADNQKDDGANDLAQNLLNKASGFLSSFGKK